MGTSDEEFEKIKNSGCNFGSEMELKAERNLAKVNKMREESVKELRDFLP